MKKLQRSRVLASRGIKVVEKSARYETKQQRAARAARARAGFVSSGSISKRASEPQPEKKRWWLRWLICRKPKLQLKGFGTKFKIIISFVQILSGIDFAFDIPCARSPLGSPHPLPRRSKPSP